MGSLQLRQLDVERCQGLAAELEAAGVGAARRKALALLANVLQRAVEWKRIPANPMQAIKRPSPKRAKEIHPLAPITIEAMRAASAPRDAALISVLAYAGLRPQEALALRWEHVGERTLTIYAPKTEHHDPTPRSVRLLAPLAQDLREWRLASGRPAPTALVFPGRDGKPWSEKAYKSWARSTARGRRRADGRRSGDGGAFGRAAKLAGVPHATPYYLRHSFCSLLLHEGRSLIYVADQLGNSPVLVAAT